MKIRNLLSLSLSFVVLLPVAGQQPKSAFEAQKAAIQEDDVVRITTNLVQLDAVVTDKNGKHVTDLRPEDFDIRVDGKPQHITNFSYVSVEDKTVAVSDVRKSAAVKNAPPVPVRQLSRDQARRVMAIVVDDLGLSFTSMSGVVSALKKTVESQMQPDDLVAIIKTSGGIGVLEQFTNDKRQLYAAIANIQWYPFGRGGISASASIQPDPKLEDDTGLIMGGVSVPGNSTPSTTTPSPLNKLNQAGKPPGENSTEQTLGMLAYVVNGLRSMPGRKSILLLSDTLMILPTEARPMTDSRFGELSESVSAQARQLIESANRSAVVIYTLNPTGLQYFGLKADDNVSRGMGSNPMQAIIAQTNARQTLARLSQGGLDYLAEQTGGLAIKNRNYIDRGIQQILKDQEGYYLIGYRPDESTFASLKGYRHFHKITIRVVHNRGLNVRHRSGFYGITDEEARPTPAADLTPGGAMFRALTSPFIATGVTLHLTSLFANQANEGSVLRAMVHVDARDLTFKQEADGWYSTAFDLLSITFGNNGRIQDRVARTHSLKLRGENYEAVLKNGFVYHVTIPLKQPGPLFLRVALRDHATAHIGSASQFMEVPDLSKGRLTLSGIQLNAESPDIAQKSPPSANSNPAKPAGEAAEDPRLGPGVRHFRSGMIVEFGYIIYNAKRTVATNRPELFTQVRLFRDGQQVFAGPVMPYDSSKQEDLGRLVNIESLRLGSNLTPGQYVFQVVVKDALVKDKYDTATQWMDFEIQQ